MNTEHAIKFWTEFRREAIDMVAAGEDIGNTLVIQIPMCDIAIEALRAQQEQEDTQPCEYCDGKNWSVLAPLFQVSTNGYPEFRLFEPDYCPKCGSKIYHEPKEAE